MTARQLKKADVIIPHHNRHDHLKNCLNALPNDIFNIVIVSGGSFAQNCNKGARLAETQNLFFVNDDTIPDVEIFKKMLKKRSDIVGVAQEIPGEGIRHGIGFDKRLTGLRVENPDELFLPCGFLFRIKKKTWEELNGFDENFTNGGEDSDLFLRALEKGKTISHVEDPIYHYHSQSEGRLKHCKENGRLWKRKWPRKKLIKILGINENTLNQ